VFVGFELHRLGHIKQSTEAFAFLLFAFYLLDKTRGRRDCFSPCPACGSITFGDILFRTYPFLTATVGAEGSELEM